MAERKNEAAWVESRQRWQINVQVDGKRRTFTSSTPGKKGKAEAERKAETWLREPTVNDQTRAGKLLDAYTAHLKATASTTHYSQYEGSIRRYISPVIGLKRMSRLTEGDLQDVIDLAYAKRDLSDKTLRDVRGCILAWLKWCRRHGYSKLHPEGLTIPAGARKPEKKIVHPAGLTTLFSSEDTIYRGKEVTDWYIHAYRFAVLTGVRPGELCGLQQGDIKGSKVTLRRSFNVHGETTQGKNNNARRTFQLPARAVAELEAQRSQLRRVGIISPYLFPDDEGGQTKEPNLYHAWLRYCKANGIPPVSLYELRHTFVSVNKEMPSGLKKMAVGHSKDMDTEGTYGHQMAGDLERAAAYSEAAFDAIIGKCVL